HRISGRNSGRRQRGPGFDRIRMEGCLHHTRGRGMALQRGSAPISIQFQGQGNDTGSCRGEVMGSNLYTEVTTHAEVSHDDHHLYIIWADGHKSTFDSL